MRVIGLSAALILAAAIVPTAQPFPQPQSPQPQGPTFRVEVSYVEIDAVVTDAEGTFVRGLTKDDFEILEDGKPQSVTAFSLVDLPVRRAAAPTLRAMPIEPDVRTNAGHLNGHVVVLVLDSLQVDAKRTTHVRAAAKQFINRFVGENDLVAVLHTGAGTTAAQNFTNNRALLLAAVDKFMGRKIQSATSATMQQDAFMRSAGGPVTGTDPMLVERAARSRDALDRLRAAADYLAAIRGRRKALIWFSEGVDTNIDNPMDSHAASVREAMTELIGTAQRAGVSFYAVDPRGVGAGLDEAIELPSPSSEDPTSTLGVTSLLEDVRRAQGTMRTISADTGGFAIVGGVDVNEQFARVIEQNSSYYVLGYYPSADKRDGKFRAVSVRVKRPGLRVQHRKGYLAPRGRADARTTAAAAAAASPELRAAVESPLPIGGLPMRVFAAPFMGQPQSAAIAIILELDPAGLRFQQQAEAFTEGLEILIVPVNAAGKTMNGARDQAPMKLSPRSHDLVRARGIRLARRLDLAPGRYQLHLAAQSANSKAVGALTYDLDVPDFWKLPLSMSGIALMSTDADRIPTPPPGKNFTDVLPMAATAIRDFAATDTLFFFSEVYFQTAGTPHALRIETTVTSESGTVVFRRTEERRTEEIKGKSGGFAHSGKFSFADAAAGRYVLKTEAKALVTGGATVVREVEFRVR